MGPYDYNLTLCPLQSRLQHIYHKQTYARVDFIPCQGLWIWPLSDFTKKQIRGRGKTIHVVLKYLVESLLQKGVRGWTITCPLPTPYFTGDPWILHLKTT
jgi:hypothetical protein